MKRNPNFWREIQTTLRDSSFHVLVSEEHNERKDNTNFAANSEY